MVKLAAAASIGTNHSAGEAIRVLQIELTAHHNPLLWFCSNGHPIEMSQLTLIMECFGNRIVYLLVS